MTDSSETVLHYRFVEGTPVGRLLLAADASGLRCLYFDGGRELRRRSLPPKPNQRADGGVWIPDTGQLDDAVTQLDEWFGGKRQQFDLPLAPRGTEFQQKVWAALCDIPWGVTISYGELATRIGNPSASRAVGLANGKNPISIIIPCHRVIGANGRLVGYGGGMDRKKTLLQLEGSLPASCRQPTLFDNSIEDSIEATAATTGNKYD